MLHSANGSLLCAMVLCVVTLTGCEDSLQSEQGIESAISLTKDDNTRWMVAFILLALCFCVFCCCCMANHIIENHFEDAGNEFNRERVAFSSALACGCFVVCIFIPSLGLGISGGRVAYLQGRTCGNFQMSQPDTCSIWLSDKKATYGWSPSECCHPLSCSCDPISQVQLTEGSYLESDCCADLESCSSYKCRTGLKNMPETYCSQSGCTTERCCVPLETCSSYNCLLGMKPLPDTLCLESGCTTDRCCVPLESCSSYNCGPGMKNMPDTYCLESGCTTERCCVPLETCDDYTGCIRSDERILNKLCDASGCTRETCCETSPYTRPCLCNAAGEGLYCETGEDQTCKTAADIDSLWRCFTSQTMCIVQHACHPRPGISAGCQQYKTRESCESQVHCQYKEDTALVHSFNCQGTEEGALQEYCSTVTTKDLCDTQHMCSWNLMQTEQSCKNQGQWIGCTEKIDAAAARCRSHARDECILNSDICNWIGACECGPDHFGPSCTKELVEFNSQVPQGFCAQEQANLSICRGFVYASSSAERHLCEREGTQCRPWQEVKRAIASIREAEIGDIIIDSLGIIFLMIAGGFRFSKWNKYVFLASLVNFLADVILEARLVTVSAEAIEAVATVRGSFCFSYGDGIASLVKLEDLVDSIVTFAWTNIGLAIFGSLCELLDTFLQYYDIEQVSMGTLLLVVGTAVSELGVGAASFTQNTQELIAEIESMESAALGLAGFEEGHACFVRSSDAEMPSTMLIGVEWNSVGFLIVPALLVSIFYIVTICLVYYKGSGHKD